MSFTIVRLGVHFQGYVSYIYSWLLFEFCRSLRELSLLKNYKSITYVIITLSVMKKVSF